MTIIFDNAQPWRQQYISNTVQDGDITGWTTASPLPSFGLKYSQAVVTKNRVYLLGGVTTPIVSIVYTAPINQDGTLGAWGSATSLPGAICGSQAILTRNRIYLLGGSTGSSVSTVYTAPLNTDGTIGTWATGVSLPEGVSNSQAIFTKNRVYLIGGFYSVTATYTAPINEDGTLGTWATGPSLPSNVSLSQAIVTKNRVYMLGGWNGSGHISTVYTSVIDSEGILGAWSTGTSLPAPTSHAQAVVVNKRAYLLGGDSSSVVRMAPVNTDGTLGTWVSGTSLPGNCADSQVIITSSRIYLLGPSTTVYTAPFSGGANNYMDASWYEEAFWTNYHGQSEIIA